MNEVIELKIRPIIVDLPGCDLLCQCAEIDQMTQPFWDDVLRSELEKIDMAILIEGQNA